MSCSILTVICERDLALFELQAESFSLYLAPGHMIIIVINENNPASCLEYYQKNISKYLKEHTVTIFDKDDFDVDWDRHHKSHYEGWANQQIIKLIVAEKIKTKAYLILDSQNFLYKSFNLTTAIQHGQYPYRKSQLVMSGSIWDSYSQNLNYNEPVPDYEIMSICTPIYFDTKLVQSAIAEHNGSRLFIKWFSSLSQIKSEFIWYYIWAETHSGIEKYHYPIEPIDDWAHPYLRDSKNFDTDVDNFISRLGKHPPHRWASINHRAWGDMTDGQYEKIVDKLGIFGLHPNFELYRQNYIVQN